MSKRAPAKVRATARQREAAELRAIGLTIDEIAERLGVSDARIRQLLDAADKNLKAESVDLARDYRDRQLLLAEGIMADLLSDFRADRDARVADQLRKWSEHVSKLTGAFAAERTELTGKDGGPIQTVGTTAAVDLTTATDEQLLQLESLLRAMQRPTEA